MACQLWGAKPLYEPMLTYCHLKPWEINSVKFKFKYKTFNSRKCIYECSFKNGIHMFQVNLSSENVFENNCFEICVLLLSSQEVEYLFLCSSPGAVAILHPKHSDGLKLRQNPVILHHVFFIVLQASLGLAVFYESIFGCSDHQTLLFFKMNTNNSISANNFVSKYKLILYKKAKHAMTTFEIHAI